MTVVAGPVVTPVPVYQNGKPVGPGFWSLAVDAVAGRTAWGLAYCGRLTHMCYDVRDIPPATAVQRVRDYGWWTFDVGHDLRVKVEDLEGGFRALGMLPLRHGGAVSTVDQTHGWHAGRDWHGTATEDACPCPQEPCGLVHLDRVVAGCKQHRMAWARAIRQWHPANRCPGPRRHR